MDKLCPSTRDLLPSHILSSVFGMVEGKEPGADSAQPSSQPSSQEAEASRSLVVGPGDGFSAGIHPAGGQFQERLSRDLVVTRGLFRRRVAVPVHKLVP